MVNDRVDLPAVAQPPDVLPPLLDDSDSDDEDGNNDAVLPIENIIHQYGNDHCIENDPVPVGSKRKLKQHQPVPPPAKDISPDHFVVEKVINHKGVASRPRSMHLFVKW